MEAQSGRIPSKVPFTIIVLLLDNKPVGVPSNEVTGRFPGPYISQARFESSRDKKSQVCSKIESLRENDPIYRASRSVTSLSSTLFTTILFVRLILAK